MRQYLLTKVFKYVAFSAFFAVLTFVFPFVNAYAADSEYVTNDNVNFRTGSSMDSEIIKVIPRGTPVEVIGESVGFYYATVDNQAGFLKAEYVSKKTEMHQLINESPADLTPWSEVRNILPIGLDLPIFDIYTGIVYMVRSFSNGLHADIEPVTTDDTQALKRTYNGVWSWDPRPVLVNINGRVLPASINGMPHGGGVNNHNGMQGQVCLHFYGSSTHNGNLRFANEHQRAVMVAYKYMGAAAK